MHRSVFGIADEADAPAEPARARRHGDGQSRRHRHRGVGGGAASRQRITANPENRLKFGVMLRQGELDGRTIESERKDAGDASPAHLRHSQHAGRKMGVLNLNDIFGKACGSQTKKPKVTVSESYDLLIANESDRLFDEEQVDP